MRAPRTKKGFQRRTSLDRADGSFSDALVECGYAQGLVEELEAENLAILLVAAQATGNRASLSTDETREETKKRMICF
jgi:hypothetical protein